MTQFTLNLSDEEFRLCSAFATESAKTQREHRSGGTEFRSVAQIASDTLRGKVAEVVIQDFLAQEPFNIKDIVLDFNIYPRGKWDEQDFTLNGKKVSIKSAKWFSKWLLLETKDINRGDTYDYYVLVTITKDFKVGTIQGFASKEELNDANTLKLRKGELIPNTSTVLDADNYARHLRDLHNNIDEWIELTKKV
jgi:hypothetical protein